MSNALLERDFHCSMGKEGDKTNTYEESLLVVFLLLDQCSVSYLYNLIFQPKQNKGNMLFILLTSKSCFTKCLQTIQQFFQIFISISYKKSLVIFWGDAWLLLQFFCSNN